MDSVNTIFIDGTPSEQALEYAGLIDQIHEIPEGSVENSLVHTIQPLIDEKKWNEVFNLSASKVEILLKLEDNKILPGFNLFLVQLKTASSDQFPSLVERCIASLVESESENGYAKLAMLETLYNAIDDVELKSQVLVGIVDVSTKHNIVKSILNLSSAIKSEAFQATSIGSQRRLFIMLYKAIKDSFKKEAYEYLLHYLYTFSEESSEAQEYANQAIVDAVSIPEVLNFESLTQAYPIQALSGQPIHDLALILLDGDVASYLAFTKKHKDLCATFDESAGLHKMRLLTVASLGAKHIGSSISYATLAEAMSLKAEDINSEVELYVIDVIRAGLIEAKLNQLEGSIIITRSTHRSFDKSQWQKLSDEFVKWNNSLDTVAKTVQAAIEAAHDSSKASLPPVAISN